LLGGEVDGALSQELLLFPLKTWKEVGFGLVILVSGSNSRLVFIEKRSLKIAVLSVICFTFVSIFLPPLIQTTLTSVPSSKSMKSCLMSMSNWILTAKAFDVVREWKDILSLIKKLMIY